METINKKNVLIFIPEFPGLSETFIQREVSKLIEWGELNITVFALKKGNGSTDESVLKNTKYKRLNLIDLMLLPFFAIFRIKSIIGAYKLVSKNPNRTHIQNCFLFVKSIGYSRIFHKFHPDIIYANFMSEPSTICLISSEILGTEFAVSAHAKDVLVTGSKLKFENSELISKKVEKSKFVTICNVNAYNKLLQNSEENHHAKIHLIYHGLDFDKITSLQTEPLEKPDPKLIFTNGRFTEKKGHRYLIEASRILSERGFSHLVYLFGGPGDYFNETVSYISELGVDSTVKIIGEGKGLPFEKVVSYYKISDVFVFPSIDTQSGDADGIANTLIEASAFMIPIVATDAGSTYELIQNEITGLVVPQRDSYELANAIERLLVDREYGQELASNAYNKAKSMFDINSNVQEIQKLLLS